ncbi:MAG TPA: zinc ribbon domain-containing protein [Abditibacteriaceae bacterium]|jgi:hypothetical protein
MIKCPNVECGYENVDGTQFCEGCGEELPQNGAAASAAPADAGAMIKCPACDNLNPADNVVCEVCGSELKAGATPPAADPAAVATPDPTLPAVTPAASTSADAMATTTGTATAAPDAAPIAPSPTPVGSVPAAPDVAPQGSGTTAPPVGAVTPSMATPGGAPNSPSTSVGSVAPVVAPDAVAGDSAVGSASPGVIVASGPTNTGAATPFDTMVTPVASGSGASGTLEPGRVKFVVEQGMTVGKQFVLGDAQMLVGREDADEDVYPDIDLSDQDEGFVHRRHAQINFANGAMTVTHLGGANKTRVNNRPLPDNEAQPVNLGDKVAFGKVVMRVQPN